MTERDLEDALVEYFENSLNIAEMNDEDLSVDVGFGPIRIKRAEAFGSRMLSLNRGITLEVEWEDDYELDECTKPGHDNGCTCADEGPKAKTQRAEFQLVIHRSR